MLIDQIAGILRFHRPINLRDPHQETASAWGRLSLIARLHDQQDSHTAFARLESLSRPWRRQSSVRLYCVAQSIFLDPNHQFGRPNFSWIPFRGHYMLMLLH